MNKIPITKPSFDAAEEQAVIDVLRSGWVVQGPRVAEFEKLFAAFTGATHAIAVTSCTAALHLALLAAGIKPGDEVLLPSLTYVATANAIEYCGARPVLVDVDLRTFTIDPEQVVATLDQSPNGPIRCMIPVSLFGLCVDYESLQAVAAGFGLTLVEDAACGFGARRRGHHAGSEALMGCLSLHPRKAITTGEGGMIVTDDSDLAASLRSLRNHGAAVTDLQRHHTVGGSLLPEHDRLGYNYRMTDLQGAIGVAQMHKAEGIIAERRRLARRYNELLAECECLTPPLQPEGYEHAYQSYVCMYGLKRLDIDDREGIDWTVAEQLNRERNILMTELEEEGISVRQGTHAVHTLAWYRERYRYDDRDFPMALLADRLSITLPLFFGMTEEEQVRVVETVCDLCTW